MIVKILHRLEMKGNTLNLIKDIYEKLSVIDTLNKD